MSKIMGLISILLFIAGWVLFSRVEMYIPLIIEVVALILAIIAWKRERNFFATIGMVGSLIIIIMMLVLFFSTKILTESGNDDLIRKAQEIEQSK